MAKYKITDPKTGKTVTISGERQPTQADAEEIFQKAGLRETKNLPKGVRGDGEVNALGKLLFPRGAAIQAKQVEGQDVSMDERRGVLGESINRIAAPLMGGGATAFGLTGAIEGATQPGATFPQRIQNAVLQGGGQYGGAKVFEAIAGPLGDVFKNPTRGIAGKNVGKATQKATKEGKYILWDKGNNNLQDQIKEAIFKKFGSDASVKKATGKFLSGRTPTPPTVMKDGVQMIGDTKLNPNEILGMRTTIKNQYGTDVFGRALSQGLDNLEVKIAGEARKVVSKNLHRLAPETLSSDKMLAIYNKLGPLGKLGAPGLALEGILGYQAARQGVNILKLLGVGD